MIRRSRRSLLASVVALAGVVACALVATSAVQLLLGERPVLDYDAVAARLHATRWEALPVAIGGGVLAALGLLVLLAAVLPGRALVLPLSGGSSAPVKAGASRRSITGSLRSAAESADGVESAKVRLRRRSVTAKVRGSRLAADDVASQVRRAVEDQLDRIGPARRPRVKVHVRRTP
ncbi:DUF6286 domain-containing protein [Amycolatopsis thermoflava]|uniref:DUF6286 domain-containing protein n=1 Tax=Amycolatopsis thermoflava TaxID=84480 RepID=A0A3N2H7Q1_9PSEU|nr:DUF6286 domain-containing protein [Amycolatopsis thermoflava]ROS44948.1 hypothetical protein EDD35_7406 [Amycolatopsis thermoflava]